MQPNVTNSSFSDGTNLSSENVFGHDVSVASYVVLVLGLIAGIGAIYCLACGPLAPLVKCAAKIPGDCYDGIKSCCKKREAAPILPMRQQDIARNLEADPAPPYPGQQMDERDTARLVPKGPE